MNGVLGTWELLANINQAVYTNAYDKASVVVVNLCNRGGTTAYVRIAVSTSATAPGNAEWIAYDQPVAPNTTYERMSIMVAPGKSVVVRSSSEQVNAVCYGVTSATAAPAGIARNFGTAPSWITSTTLPIFYAGDETTSVQLLASDAESEPVTYSVTGGTLLTGLSLSSNGLITGAPSTTGYTSGLPDSTSTVTISATDSRGLSTPRTFNIIKRWSDGSTQALAATNAQAIYNLSATFRGSAASNWFWIKGATEDTSQARRMYCSMNGAGYMLWYHYRDPMSGSLTISDPSNSGTTYGLTSTTDMFMYALPNAIANNVTYLYLNSDGDASFTTPAFVNFKYAVSLNPELRLWLTNPKTRGSYWGITGTPVNSVRVTDNGAINYRYGESIGQIQFGHNNGGGDEVDGLAFRNTFGTGGALWTSSSDIWNKAGWGPIDASSPSNVNTGWGSTGIDESNWGGTNRQYHLYAWVK